MKEFDVTITETLKLTVSVEASSKEEARQMVSDQWHACLLYTSDSRTAHEAAR